MYIILRAGDSLTGIHISLVVVVSPSVKTYVYHVQIHMQLTWYIVHNLKRTRHIGHNAALALGWRAETVRKERERDREKIKKERGREQLPTDENHINVLFARCKHYYKRRHICVAMYQLENEL